MKMKYEWTCIKCGAQGEHEDDYPQTHIEKDSDPKVQCTFVAWPVLKQQTIEG
jgi:hypothetical protein